VIIVNNLSLLWRRRHFPLIIRESMGPRRPQQIHSIRLICGAMAFLLSIQVINVQAATRSLDTFELVSKSEVILVGRIRAIESKVSRVDVISVQKGRISHKEMIFPLFINILDSRRSGSRYTLSIMVRAGTPQALSALEKTAKNYPDQSVSQEARWWLAHRERW